MPWKVSDVYDQRVRFVSAALRGDLSLAALCRAYGISRETGYKWIERYHRSGWAGLEDASRAPHRQARAMAPDVAAAIVALRRAHPFWGPKKLRAVLEREHSCAVWPALSTIDDLMLVSSETICSRSPGKALEDLGRHGSSEIAFRNVSDCARQGVDYLGRAFVCIIETVQHDASDFQAKRVARLFHGGVGFRCQNGRSEFCIGQRAQRRY